MRTRSEGGAFMESQANVLKWTTCLLDNPIKFLKIYDLARASNKFSQNNYYFVEFKDASSCQLQFICSECSKVNKHNELITIMSCEFKLTMMSKDYLEVGKHLISLSKKINNLKFETNFGEYQYDDKQIRFFDKVTEIRDKGKIEIIFNKSFDSENRNEMNKDNYLTFAQNIFDIKNSAFNLMRKIL